MTEQNETKVDRHTGDGNTTRFYFGFTLPDADPDKLFVKLRDVNTLGYTILVRGTDYEIEDVVPGSAGGYVVMTNAVDVERAVEIYSDDDPEQNTSDNDFYTKGQREDGDDKRANKDMELRDRIETVDTNTSGNPPSTTTQPTISRPTQAGTYVESNVDTPGEEYWQEFPIVVTRPTTQGYALYSNSDGSTTWTDDLIFDGVEFVKQTSTWRFAAGGDTKALGLDLTTGSYSTMFFSIDNDALPDYPIVGITLEGGNVKLVAKKDRAESAGLEAPTQEDSYLVSTLVSPGVYEWVEADLVIKPNTITGQTLSSNSDGRTTWQGDLIHDGTEFVKQTDSFKYTDTTRTAALGIALDVGTIDAIKFAIDEAVITTDSFAKINYDGDTNTVLITAADASSGGGGVTTTDPVTEQYHTKFVSSTSISSSHAFDTTYDHGNTGSGADTVAAPRFMNQSGMAFRRSASHSVLEQASQNGIYTVVWDIGQGISRMSDMHITPVTEDNYYIRAIEPDPSELFHTSTTGGTVDNVPTFLEGQEVDVVKYVEDSALANGADYFKDITLLRPNLGGISHINASATINAGVLTLDLNESLYFVATFNEDITEVVITKKNASDRQKVYLIFLYENDLFDITWNSSYLFGQGIAWKTSGQSIGSLVELEFTALDDTRWLVTPITAPLRISESSTIFCYNPDDGGNVITLSGSGRSVVATGEPRIEDATIKNITAETITIGAVYYPTTTIAIASGTLTIATLGVHEVFNTTATEDVTTVDVTSVFDRALSKTFSIIVDEPTDDFTMNFGNQFLTQGGENPTPTVAGRTRHFTFMWCPGIQMWLSTRQQ